MLSKDHTCRVASLSYLYIYLLKYHICISFPNTPIYIHDLSPPHIIMSSNVISMRSRLRRAAWCHLGVVLGKGRDEVKRVFLRWNSSPWSFLVPVQTPRLVLAALRVRRAGTRLQFLPLYNSLASSYLTGVGMINVKQAAHIVLASNPSTVS